VANSFNLTKALSGLSLKDAKYGKLVRALRNLAAARSVNTDLSEAKEALEVAGRAKIQNFGSVERDVAIQVEALFVHAVLLYCRATHSSTRARHRIDVLGQYSAELKTDHKRITSLRDSVIAHYGSEDEISGSWNSDHVVQHLRPDGFTLSYPQFRVAHKAETTRALSRLVEASLTYIENYGLEKQNEVVSELQQMAADGRLLSLIRSQPFDEKSYFGFSNPPGSNDRIVVPAGAKPFK
jgi:hypothetical protein